MTLPDTPQETAVAAANLAFYRALEARELSAIDLVWSHSETASCIHPGWHRLDGWREIRRSWENIFESSRPWTVTCEDVRIVISGEMAWVSCVEVIRPFGSTRPDAAARMQATNLFAREDGDWKMIHHHASASPDDETEEETVN
ncbi:MAG: nuclear transport factor 2 family protein [Acidobacteriota bacterium]|nr:nuclear transport factor 2 family protein [Acidobacteriota bacterium]